MPQDPIQLAVVIASTRNGRFGPTVARWLVTHLVQRDDIRTDVVDLADAGLPDVLGDHADPVPQVVQRLAPRLASADAFVVVTPEYNHSFPAPLKTCIDWYHDEWKAKPVAFVSYGGISGGLRAVEALRLVFAEVHAMSVRDTVSFANYHERFDPSGTPSDQDGAGTAVKRQLDQLTWWAQACRSWRAEHPYDT